MNRSTRIGAATVATTLACAFLLIGAVAAPAAGPPIESYQSGGQARGIDVAFTFSGSIFERLLDLGIPASTSSVSSAGGGGSSRGTAAQLYPGDLVIGGVPEKGELLPGYRQAVYPREVPPDAPDDSHFTDTFQLPGSLGNDQVSLDTSHLRTTADENSASGRVTTHLAKLGQEMPLFTVTSVETSSESNRYVDHVEHKARTVMRDITMLISPELTVKVGQLVSEAKTSSDGAEAKADSHLTISGTTVKMNGVTYEAEINEEGIRIVGAPTVPLPSPLPADVVPGIVPADVNQTLGLLLNQENVRISTAEGTNTVEDVSADSSISGLLITFTGIVPNVFVPDVVAQLLAQVETSIENNEDIPEDIRTALFDSICYTDHIKPKLPKQITENPDFPNLPLCVSAQAVPGPGSGVVTTFSLGSVRSQSAAVQVISFTDIPGGGGDFGEFPPPAGDLGGEPFPGGSNGFVPPGTGAQPGTITTGPRTGLVARLPSAALLGSGLGFLALAMGLTMGPSVRRWRTSPTP